MVWERKYGANYKKLKAIFLKYQIPIEQKLLSPTEKRYWREVLFNLAILGILLLGRRDKVAKWGIWGWAKLISRKLLKSCVLIESHSNVSNWDAWFCMDIHPSTMLHILPMKSDFSNWSINSYDLNICIFLKKV
jgi:hypothetical protein